ncbi:MAG: MFS transporter [Bryobacterales bacterium]|nr:MFS transporter [Bryobacterales bacterium]
MSDARRWSIVGLLCFGMMVAFFDRATLSVALASPEFKAQFQLTDWMRGALGSAFFLSYAFLQVPGGFVVDRFGVKRPYGLSYFFWCVTAGLTALARGFPMLLGLRVMLGIGEVVVTPASLKWIGTNLPEVRRGLATGLLFAFAKLGPAFGTIVAAKLLQNYGWRVMFLITGFGALLWLIPWWLTVPLDRGQPLRGAGGTQPRLASLFKTPLIWGILIGTFSYNYFQYFCLTWLPAYFVEHRGLSLTSSGWYNFFTFGGMAIVAVAAGWAADSLIRWGHDPALVRRLFTAAGFLVASTEVFGAWTSSQTLALTFAIVSLSGLGLATANYWALTQTLLPGPAVGRIAGIQNMASNLAGIVAPMLTGWLKEVTGGYMAAFQAVLVFLLLGLVCYLGLVRRKYVPAEFRNWGERAPVAT